MYVKKLTPNYAQFVWDLLKEADQEFIPPLSSRTSTDQKDLLPGKLKKSEGPVQYFEVLKDQQFILALKDDEVVGFLSYMSDYKLEVLNSCDTLPVYYISTIIVRPDWRNKGLTKKMYKELLQNSRGIVATRTWSTNHAHIHILKELGFTLFSKIADDRGKGIDTVYYLKYR